MARIQTYDNDVNLTDSDRLVGTDGSPGADLDQTKNFTLGDLKNYIGVGPTSPTPTLDQVLTAGNTSLLNAKIGELYLYDIANIGYGRAQLSNNIFNITTASGDDLFSNEIGLLRVWNAIGVEGVINYTNLTGGRIYAMPDDSGTIALTSDIPPVIDNENYVRNTTDTFTATPKIKQIVTLSQVEYDALPSPATDTLYIIL